MLQIPIKRCWARQFCIFGRRDSQIVHWWESWKCAWWMCLLQEKKIFFFYLRLCLSLPHLSKSVKYQDTCTAAASKISWIAALVLMFGDLSAAARAVSLCKTCDTVTGGHCQAGLSQRVLRKKLTNSERGYILTGEWGTHWGFAAEMWRDRHFRLVRWFKKMSAGVTVQDKTNVKIQLTMKVD